MDMVKWRALSRDEKLYFAQFAAIGAVATATFLSLFGLPAVFVVVAAGTLTTVSFIRGRAAKNYLSAVVSIPVLVSAIALFLVS